MVIVDNFELTEYNSYGINSICAKAFFPTSEEDFLKIYESNPEKNKVLLGGGYNVILSKQQYEDYFILIGKSFSKISLVENNILEVEAGASLEDLSLFALGKQLTGMEIFYDIPSSMGGAVVMNAGASGEDIKGILKKVRYLDLKDSIIKEIDGEDIGFEYRNSFFQRNTDKIVLKAWLALRKGDKVAIREKMELTKQARWAKQPKEYPNAGSVFKRPKGYYVGTMIEELGLKGLSVGGAKVSEKHAGFIVNFKEATGKDILDLIKIIQDKVYQEFDVMLEVEQRVI